MDKRRNGRVDPEVFGDGRHTAWVPKKKVPAFLTLFIFVSEKLGGDKKAEKYTGIKRKGIKARLRRGEASAGEARKIMDAYNKLKQE